MLCAVPILTCSFSHPPWDIRVISVVDLLPVLPSPQQTFTISTTSLRQLVYKYIQVCLLHRFEQSSIKLSTTTEQIGVELDKHPFTDELRGRDSPDDVLKLLEDKANAFKPIEMEIAS